MLCVCVYKCPFYHSFKSDHTKGQDGEGGVEVSLKVKFEKACNSKYALYISLLSAQLNSSSLLKTYMTGSMLDWGSKRNEMLP